MEPISTRHIQQVRFGRAFTPGEAADWLALARRVMGPEGLNKELTVIWPDPCMNSRKGQNVGVGSRLQQGCLDIMDFLKQYFNASNIQFCPDGEHVKEYDAQGQFVASKSRPSLYSSRTFMKTTLMADLLALTTPAWGKILSKGTYRQSVLKARGVQSRSLATGPDRVRYQHAFPAFDQAFDEAFRRFEQKRAKGDPIIKALHTQFERYQAENAEWLEKEGFYNQLKIEHANDPQVVATGQNLFRHWVDGVDKNLFGALQSTDEQTRRAAEVRRDELNQHYNVRKFKFSQFVISKMIEDRNREAAAKGFTLIGDKKISIVDADVWGNQDAFLMDKWRLGTPPDYFGDGQPWSFYLLDPDKFFIRDGAGKIQMEQGKPKLGPAGKFLYTVYNKIFKENPGGVRIDHAIGLVDPWVYPAGDSPKSPEAGRLFSSPEHPELGRYSKIKLHQLTPDAARYAHNRVNPDLLTETEVQNYSGVLEHIVLAAAQQHGVERKNIIFEDLGVITTPVTRVMAALGLGGIRVTEFDSPGAPDAHNWNRGRNIPPHYMAALGTHDNNSLMAWVREEVFPDRRKKAGLVSHLVEDLRPDDSVGFRQQISRSRRAFATAKVAELFTVPAQRVQIFWADLFGIAERFNSPADRTGEIWSLRMPGSTEKLATLYQQQIRRGRGINLPEVLKMALIAKRNKQSDNPVGESLNTMIEQLDRFARILQEPENKHTQRKVG